METDNKFAVLVLSCDKYFEAWEPFFCLFRKYWKECSFPLYLTTESLSFDKYGVTTLNTGSGAWTKRVKDALERIESEYVFIFLEDFFFQRQVDLEKTEEAIDIITKNQDIASMYFIKVSGFTKQSEYPDYILMDPEESKKYVLNCQAAIWRKEVLEQACLIDMSPWAFELEGVDKVPDCVKTKTFLCYNRFSPYGKIEDAIFPYLFEKSLGYGIYRGVWLWNNKKLFKENGIGVNFRKLKKWSKFSYKCFLLNAKIKHKIISRIKKNEKLYLFLKKVFKHNKE